MANSDWYIQLDTRLWLTDPDLMRCGYAAKGLWMDLICLMHQSVEPGVLVGSNGRPWKQSEIIQNLRGKSSEIRRGFRELLDANVLKTRDEDGAFFCAKMVRDYTKKAKTRDDGNKRQQRYRGKNKRSGNAESDGDVTPGVTHSSRDDDGANNAARNAEITPHSKSNSKNKSNSYLNAAGLNPEGRAGGRSDAPEQQQQKKNNPELEKLIRSEASAATEALGERFPAWREPTEALRRHAERAVRAAYDAGQGEGWLLKNLQLLIRRADADPDGWAAWYLLRIGNMRPAWIAPNDSGAWWAPQCAESDGLGAKAADERRQADAAAAKPPANQGRTMAEPTRAQIEVNDLRARGKTAEITDEQIARLPDDTRDTHRRMRDEARQNQTKTPETVS